MADPRKMLNIEQVLEIVPVSRTTLWRMVRAKRFPKCHRHHLSPGYNKAWFADEVAEWQATPTAERIVTRRRKLEHA
jgi:prophage regulatory protein